MRVRLAFAVVRLGVHKEEIWLNSEMPMFFYVWTATIYGDHVHYHQTINLCVVHSQIAGHLRACVFLCVSPSCLLLL